MNVTATLGYGVKVDLEALAQTGTKVRYAEDVLDEALFPALVVKPSGFAPHEEYWVFVASTCTSIRSADNTETSATFEQITYSEAEQLTNWLTASGQDATPGYSLIQYVN